MSFTQPLFFNQIIKSDKQTWISRTSSVWLTEWLGGQWNLCKVWANVTCVCQWEWAWGGVVIWERVGERWLYSLWSRAVCLVCRAYRAERSMTNTAQQVRAINYTQAWMREGWGDIEREEQRACYAQCHPQGRREGKLTLDFKASADPRDEASASWTRLCLITPVVGPEMDTQCQRIQTHITIKWKRIHLPAVLTETPGSEDDHMKPSEEKEDHDGTCLGSKLDVISKVITKQPQKTSCICLKKKREWNKEVI